MELKKGVGGIRSCKKTLTNSMQKHGSLYILHQVPLQRNCWNVKGKTHYIMT